MNKQQATRSEEIVMLNEILDYLNAHQLRSLLDLNTQRLNGLHTDAKRYHTDIRQLTQIRRALCPRLGLPDDSAKWEEEKD
jgi:hypothetical protein